MTACRIGVAVGAAIVLAVAGLGGAEEDPQGRPTAEYHFLRLEYRDLAQARWRIRGWWMMDWPAADIHFAQGIRRLTRIDTGEGRHLPLLDDRIFDYPWIYATQTGYWDLSDAETARLREYLARGGFLMTDDFHGPQDWELFRQTMERVLPGRPITEMEEDHPAMQVLYRITDRVQIPGLRHLRRDGRGGIVIVPQYTPPYWRAIHDDQGRLIVAIHFNQDVGDAWEHADMPEYPMEMTGLAYRFGINYILYAMTH